MTDDLSTLLRDAGREPTIDLDVDAVHARGRRRTVVRRTAAGVGALALLGALAVGLPQLLDGDRPGLDVVDDVPRDEATEDPSGVGTTSRATVTAMLGQDLALHRLIDATTDTWEVERTNVDGTTSSRTVALPPMLGTPVVDAAGNLWSASTDGQLLRDGIAPANLDPQLTGAWWPVGTDAFGHVIVAPQPAPPGAVGTIALHSLGPDGAIVTSNLASVAAELPVGATILAVDEHAERGLALFGIDVSDGSVEPGLLLVPYRGEVRDLLSEPAVAAAVGDRAVVTAALVGDDVWIAAASDDGTELVQVPVDPTGAVTVLPAPGLGSFSSVASIDASDDGSTVLLGRQSTTLDLLAPYVVRPDLVEVGAAGAITALDATGFPALLPASRDASPQASCVERPLNTVPGDQLSAWFLCGDATSQLGDDVAHPFVREVVPGTDLVADVTGIRMVLELWAAGPSEDQAASGLTGGLDAEVATIADVTLDGSAVTVDLASGPQVGVLGTTTGRATTVQAIVGAVLQFDGRGDLAIDRVAITLDGSCADWAALAETEGCPTYDEADAPWRQGLATDASALPRTDLEDGRHMVYVTGTDAARPSVTVDVVQWLTGEEARAAFEAETGDAEGPPNGYLIVNENDRLRTLPADTDADVQLVRLAQTGSPDLEPADWQGFVAYLVELGSDGTAVTPFWLTLEDGIVTAIEEQYVP